MMNSSAHLDRYLKSNTSFSDVDDDEDKRVCKKDRTHQRLCLDCSYSSEGRHRLDRGRCAVVREMKG